MKKHIRIYFKNLLGILLVFVSSCAYGEEAISNIRFTLDEAKVILEQLKSYAKPENIEAIERLENAIDRGVKVNKDLENMVYSYRNEKDELTRLKTKLSTSLIAAIVAAILTIVGAYIKLKGSKAERDLKRLSVIEKALELIEQGADLPKDIKSRYLKKLTSKST